jgi:hypothetical protein
VKRAIENLFTLNAKYKHFKDTFPHKKHVFFFFFFWGLLTWEWAKQIPIWNWPSDNFLMTYET